MKTKDRKLWKGIEAGKLAAILDGLPPESLVAVNSVGNLSVYDAHKQLVGVVDMATGDWADFRSRLSAR